LGQQIGTGRKKRRNIEDCTKRGGKGPYLSGLGKKEKKGKKKKTIQQGSSPGKCGTGCIHTEL